MTFLDTSVIIDMLDPTVDGVEDVAERHGRPFLTSSICVFEVLNGILGSGSTDVVAERNRFGGVRALAFTDQLALDAARRHAEITSDGGPRRRHAPRRRGRRRRDRRVGRQDASRRRLSARR